MANLEERTPSHEQSMGDKKTEQDEIDNFNQNTDYDPRPELRTPVEDPFSDHNLAIQQFISTARVYDALLTLIKLQGDEGAAAVHDLLDIHSKGHLLASSPSFSGHFLTDEMNADDEPTEQ